MGKQDISILLVGQLIYRMANLLSFCHQAGLVVTHAKDGLDALNALQNKNFDFTVVDDNVGRIELEAFIKAVKKINPETIILFIASEEKHEDELEWIKQGVYDCLPSSISEESFITLIQKIILREGITTTSEKTSNVSFPNIVAKSPAMLQVLKSVERLANFNTTVLLKGESGTGKELLAHAIHNNSARKGKPFVAINCGAIPDNLMESELFGHKKGSFTDAVRDKIGLFEEADGGTVFLDEIGDMPLHLQVKILRVLQERKIQMIGDNQPKDIDVRVIAATLRDLEQDVASGRFREDLYYRLNVVTLELPPLRERKDDIESLVRFFLKKHNKRLGTNIRYISREALDKLMAYNWKGNVRELENCIEHAMVMSPRSEIELTSLPDNIKQTGESKSVYSFDGIFRSGNYNIKECSAEFEKQLIMAALRKTSGNRTHAAKLLVMGHRTLLYKLKEYNLENYCK